MLNKLYAQQNPSACTKLRLLCYVASINWFCVSCSQARVGGMLSGKCGLVYCHMGAAKEGLQPLLDAVSHSDVPITQFLPTHVERTPEMISEGIIWLRAGGYVNLTCRTHEVCQLVVIAVKLRHKPLTCNNCVSELAGMLVYNAAAFGDCICPFIPQRIIINISVH